MTPETPITITPAGNGFVVERERDIRDNRISSKDDRLVFESLVGLTAWLGQHFTHRNTGVPSDLAPTSLVAGPGPSDPVIAPLQQCTIAAPQIGSYRTGTGE